MSESANKICIFCASSQACHEDYHSAAYRLGQILAEHGSTIVYGGGGAGSMGALADGAISKEGRIIGIIPKFMQDLEWGHSGLTELKIVEDMRLRKHLMMSDSNAIVALPGGTGTLEELLEAVTLKRLGLYLNPIVLVNTRGFFDPLIQLLSDAVGEGFMDERHHSMWQVVSTPENVLTAISTAPSWSIEARKFATL
ncbi:MAG: TIGR00730 family Rossman fold protein [Candidatus Eisenbacteria bacterium]|uniref:Cytokinin riboside 5'-monophosphate phosphoribohydrolase n=1 Tax=Eiseniibacteriota bacterium TaxID=2212470 RepID=A0A948W515_UNCEI|nr:TIGR00730 family Rossman fold protein [Candidatus Eisenbacteria bacterium]MBU1949557.1 TIGR00730 family Rossman fold protein [Candidatus Eisenbacteria bacterium]MBU2689560.1 TIGR00730 family Rossman fold protein [Candidatus Eisenbacteria bacterium]